MIYDPTVLGDETSEPQKVNLSPYFERIYQSLPPKSKEFVDNLPNDPKIKFIQENFSNLNQDISGYTNKQIQEFKLMLIEKLKDKAVESVLSNP